MSRKKDPVKRTYSKEFKLKAVNHFFDEGYSKPEILRVMGITNMTQLKLWIRAYRTGGPDALDDRRGRMSGGRPPKAITREEELERQVKKLEMEIAALKKLQELERRDADQEPSLKPYRNSPKTTK